LEEGKRMEKRESERDVDDGSRSVTSTATQGLNGAFDTGVAILL
jgi:hypothetical protein